MNVPVALGLLQETLQGVGGRSAEAGLEMKRRTLKVRAGTWLRVLDHRISSHVEPSVREPPNEGTTGLLPPGPSPCSTTSWLWALRQTGCGAPPPTPFGPTELVVNPVSTIRAMCQIILCSGTGPRPSGERGFGIRKSRKMRQGDLPCPCRALARTKNRVHPAQAARRSNQPGPVSHGRRHDRGAGGDREVRPLAPRPAP